MLRFRAGQDGPAQTIGRVWLLRGLHAGDFVVVGRIRGDGSERGAHCGWWLQAWRIAVGRSEEGWEFFARAVSELVNVSSLNSQQHRLPGCNDDGSPPALRHAVFREVHSLPLYTVSLFDEVGDESSEDWSLIYVGDALGLFQRGNARLAHLRHICDLGERGEISLIVFF